MIDTGSTRSFMSPEIANYYFSDFKYQEPFEVISTHSRSKHGEVIYIPLLKTFQSPLKHKFYLYSIDKNYDGLIGSDLLTELEATVDMKNQLLITPNTRIPIIYSPPRQAILEPRSETRVKIPTSLENGEAIVDYRDFGNGIRMPSAIVTCKNGLAETIIQNLSEESVTLTFHKPFQVQPFQETEIKCHFNTATTDYDVDEILKDNLNKIRLDHMNEEERKAIFQLCYEYRDIFYTDKLPLTFTNQVKHEIRTTNEDPIYVKPYRLPPVLNEEINRQVEKLLKDNVIQESHSPWSAPVHLVPKKLDASGERKFRMVVDYRRLNEITTDDKFPLPNITDLLDKLGKSIYFSTIDLASGYHQVEVLERDRKKTAFSTQNGHYEFTRMPFGLKTAPATFQRAMNNVLRGLHNIHCMVYLDDVIIFSASLQEHIHKLKTVFQRLRESNLKVQLDKTEFLCKEVLYLGHKITQNGLQPNDDKIQAVLNYPIPKTTTEIKSFLGLIGYYRRFIKNFAQITKPLTNCLKKRNKIVIDQQYIDAFQKCKELLTNAPLLQYPDPEKTFILTTDASQIALGAVLSQGAVGSDLPVAYASRTLTETESRYSTIERELLAIVWAIKHFRPYLYGKKFIIYTDHRPLAWLHSLKEPSSKLTRWRLNLLDYDFDIVYKKGKQNSNADALSRIKVNALSDKDSMVVNYDKKDLPRDSQDSRTITISDSEKEKTITISDSSSEKSDLENITYPVPSLSSKSDTIHSAQDLQSHGIPILHEAIDTKPNQILVFQWYKNSMQVQDRSREKQKVLEVFLPIDNQDLIKQFLKEYIKPKTKYFIYFEQEEHRKQFSNIIISLFKGGSIQFFECTERVVFIEDENEQKAVILKFHLGKTCHRGIRETLTHIRRHFFWHNMTETISAVINSCDVCKKMKYDRKPLKPYLQLTQTQEAPFQEIFIDLFTIEGKIYLTLVDAFSKLGQAIEISSKSTPEVIRALIKYFSYYGVPKKISCDPGTEFNNELLKEMMSLYKIQLHIGTPRNPNSMGIVERFHSTLIEIYRLAKYEQQCTDAASIMTYSIMAYNNSIHSVTNLTPFEVVFGHVESENPFNVNFEKQYLQKLMKDHAKRTKVLYKYISDKMLTSKEKSREKRGGEADIQFSEGKPIFTKLVNTRRSKDKPRFEKAIVTGKPERNIVPVTVRGRQTRIPIKNIKRPSQVLLSGHDGSHEPQPGPSTSKD
ncbi:hypothetical protein JYU34_019262 [Plutella xylostella]|uniref:RNA-directed DNA polymerase n=2 Tax=Plutella xylostella TaxID=51655 RepID=A0ABQ7PX37_PLUXY|nr:hypothetical protein JYU34_019262 [Plutella xylostella]